MTPEIIAKALGGRKTGGGCPISGCGAHTLGTFEHAPIGRITFGPVVLVPATERWPWPRDDWACPVCGKGCAPYADTCGHCEKEGS